jgi:uncharacterized protein
MVDLLEALISGMESVLDYLSGHVLTCLVPAFFIAGAIAALIMKEAILRYFGPLTKRWLSLGIASISGTVLAVCSCTILPLFAGIYRKGSGIGPATTFLFAGPAINVLAIIYTAQVLGYGLGLARAVAAVVGAIAIGLLMALLFKRHDRTILRTNDAFSTAGASIGREKRPRWVTMALFTILVAILVIAASQLDLMIKGTLVIAMLVGLLVLLRLNFRRDEMEEWGLETWDLTKKIFPILIGGTFVVGVIAYFLPPETFAPYLGGNSLSAVALASVLGTLLYMPTLLEVPIIGTTFGYLSGVMGGGPALALLLSGPTISLPSIIVLYRIMGWRKTGAYVALTLIISTISGLIYGSIWG